MRNLKDLFEHQLKDLYSAETQMIEALPKMAKDAHDKQLKEAIESHLEETKKQKKRLQEVCDDLGIKPSGEECKAMKGLVNEADSFLKEDADPDVRDAGIIAEAQRVEHYEISGYGTLIRYAKELGHKNIAEKLANTLKEEYGADDKLNKLAESRLNEEAK